MTQFDVNDQEKTVTATVPGVEGVPWDLLGKLCERIQIHFRGYAVVFDGYTVRYFEPVDPDKEQEACAAYYRKL